MVNGLHLYRAFIQSGVQFMPLIHTPTEIGCHARYQPACQEQLRVRRLAQGHFDTPRVGSNRQPSNCQTTALPPEPYRPHNIANALKCQKQKSFNQLTSRCGLGNTENQWGSTLEIYSVQNYWSHHDTHYFRILRLQQKSMGVLQLSSSMAAHCDIYGIYLIPIISVNRYSPCNHKTTFMHGNPNTKSNNELCASWWLIACKIFLLACEEPLSPCAEKSRFLSVRGRDLEGAGTYANVFTGMICSYNSYAF